MVQAILPESAIPSKTEPHPPAEPATCDSLPGEHEVMDCGQGSILIRLSLTKVTCHIEASDSAAEDRLLELLRVLHCHLQVA